MKNKEEFDDLYNKIYSLYHNWDQSKLTDYELIEAIYKQPEQQCAFVFAAEIFAANHFKDEFNRAMMSYFIY